MYAVSWFRLEIDAVRRGPRSAELSLDSSPRFLKAMCISVLRVRRWPAIESEKSSSSRPIRRNLHVSRILPNCSPPPC